MNKLIFKHPERVLYEGLEMPVTQVQKIIRKQRLGKIPGLSVPFGPDRNQKIVVFEPEEVLHETVILYFHGGGYLVGTPESMDIGAAFFTERGYRFISLGYRLMPKYQFPAQVEDAFAGLETSIQYLSSNPRVPEHANFLNTNSNFETTKAYRLNSEKASTKKDSIPASIATSLSTAANSSFPPLVVGGNSAGGQLAAILGFSSSSQFSAFSPKFEPLSSITQNSQAAHSNSATQGSGTVHLNSIAKHHKARTIIQGVISLAGVMDQDDMLPSAGHEWSPYHMVLEHGLPNPPPQFLAIHGTHDVLSPYSSEVRFTNLLNSTANRHIADLVPLEDWKAQHIYLTAGVFTRENKVLDTIFEWLNKNFD